MRQNERNPAKWPKIIKGRPSEVDIVPRHHIEYDILLRIGDGVRSGSMERSIRVIQYFTHAQYYPTYYGNTQSIPYLSL